jgi:hypothetical protein
MLTALPLTIIAIACGCVALILAFGIGQMGRGGVEGARRSNKLMQYRLLAQGITVVLVVVLVTLFKKTGG